MKRITIDLEPPFDYGNVGIMFVGLGPDAASFRTCTVDIQKYGYVRVSNSRLQIGKGISLEVDTEEIKNEPDPPVEG